MAKRGRKVLPARKEDAPKRDDDSLLVRSAESLGRVIGSLQRQVQGTTKRAASIADDAIGALPEMPRFDSVFGSTRKNAPRKARATRKTSSRKASGARKSSGARKGSGARKTSAARKRASSRTSSKKR